jgi:hypothetical protein
MKMFPVLFSTNITYIGICTELGSVALSKNLERIAK